MDRIGSVWATRGRFAWGDLLPLIYSPAHQRIEMNISLPYNNNKTTIRRLGGLTTTGIKLFIIKSGLT